MPRTARAPARARAAAPVLAAAAAAVLLVGACGAAAPRAAPSATTPPTTAPAGPPGVPGQPVCPTSSQAGERWPAPVPADLPILPSARLGNVRQSADGVTLVQFTTSSSLRQGVVFLVEALPRAGYTVGRGDAEATEADAPFVKGDLRGEYRLLSRDTCSTVGLLALSRAAATDGGPLLPMRSRAPSASPLPFG